MINLVIANDKCADCRESGVEKVNLIIGGIFLCEKWAEIHERSFNQKMRPVDGDFLPEELDYIEEHGNAWASAKF